MVAIYFDCRGKSKSYPVKIKVSLDNGRFYINTGVYVSPDNFDKTKKVGEQIHSVRNAEELNTLIRIMFYKVETDITSAKILAGGKITLEQAKLAAGLIKEKDYNFIERLNDYINHCNKKNTKYTYEYTRAKLKEFTNENITFESINVSFMRDFDRFLERKVSVNTRSIIYRCIRSIFNMAIDENLIGANIYPFRKFKIKNEQTIKRSLTLSQLRKLRTMHLEPFQQRYRDIFMLIFYLCGINMIDLAELKEIKNGYICYRRSKTNKLYTIKVEPEAAEIINKYKGKNYLINIKDNYKNYYDFTRRMNKALQRFGECSKVGRGGRKVIDSCFPHLTSYWARHTWATIAAELDIPKETIAAALGHGAKNVTDIYINFDTKKIEAANRIIIDKTNSGFRANL